MSLLSVQDLEKTFPFFRGKVGNVFARFLMNITSIDDINILYQRNESFYGPEFARHILKDVGVSYKVFGDENLKKLPDGPFITISNHPYGGIDGVILTDLFGHIRSDYKLMVNKFLGIIERLSQNFITVVPNGEEKHEIAIESVEGIRKVVQHLSDGHPLGMFPSGAVSDLSLKEKCVKDREWQHEAIKLIKKASLPVIPVKFFDGNSAFFYLLGLISWKVRLLRLPSEILNKRGQQIRIGIGSPITVEQQKVFNSFEAYSAFLRDNVYGITCDTVRL